MNLRMRPDLQIQIVSSLAVLRLSASREVVKADTSIEMLSQTRVMIALYITSS